MSREFESISYLLDNRFKRSAWIGGIGTIFKQIFGTLDENDAIMYDNAITSVQSDNKKLASLIKKNILVTTSIISEYNNTLNKINNNEINLNSAIEKLTLNLRNISESTNGLHTLAVVSEVFEFLETSILTLSFQLEDIINAIMFSHQNTLHPAIITPFQLQQELVENYRHLPNNIKFPVNLDISSLFLVLSVSKLKCYYINHKLIFLLEVPLVDVKEYMLFHSIALPTPYNPAEPNSFNLITPNGKYIAVTKDKTHYCHLDDLKNCKIISPGNYICDIPNVYATDAKPSCESELLTKVISGKPLQCETKFIRGQFDIWKPLANNKWLFVQSEANKISIDCINSKLFEINVLGTGIISIPHGCIGYCKSTTLIPKFDILNITSPINHIPNFNLINDSCCNIANFQTALSNNVSYIKLQKIDLDEFNTKSKLLLESYIKDAEEIENAPHIVKYGVHYSSLTLILYFIVIVVIIFKIYKFFKLRRHGKPQTPELSPKPKDSADTDSNNDFAPVRVQI